MAKFSPQTPLAQLRAWLHSKRAEGVTCPVCDQHVKIYRRKVNAGMARSLISMYRAGGTDFVHLPTAVGARSREEGKLRYWGLVEEQSGRRGDGGRSGYWRVTEAGELFIANKLRIRQYAEVYDGQCLALTGEMVNIKDAIGDAFAYDELMSEVATV